MDPSRALVSFKAGKAVRREGTNWVDPLPTKGLVSIAPSDDGLLHFYWANRESSSMEEDLILFPGDASFVPVAEAQGGRTYVLKFTSSDQRLFFWMQDANASHDAELVVKLNNALNQSSEEGDESMEASASELEPISPLATQAAPGALARNGTSPEELARLRSLLQSMGARGGHGSRNGGGLMEPELSLSDILTPTNLQPLLSNHALLRTIFPTLPSDLPGPSPPSSATVRKIIESPPFQASVRQLDLALATGMLQGLVIGLGLPSEAGSGVEAFLRAVGEQAKKMPPPEGGEMDTSS